MGLESEEEAKGGKALVSIALTDCVFLKIVISSEYFRESIIE